MFCFRSKYQDENTARFYVGEWVFINVTGLRSSAKRCCRRKCPSQNCKDSLQTDQSHEHLQREDVQKND